MSNDKQQFARSVYMCGICDRIKETKAGNNPFLVKELETGYVVIGMAMCYLDYKVFMKKEFSSENNVTK